MSSDHPRAFFVAARCARREEGVRLPTTQGFAALHDHARLPWRFFGRFTSSIAARLTGA